MVKTTLQEVCFPLPNVVQLDDVVLVDKGSGGRPRPWSEKKVANELLSLAYDTVDPSKAARLRDCASWLTFALDGDEKKLKSANFCRVRLCPMCQWRRALKTYGQVRAILDYLKRDRDYCYLFLTLTVKNCYPDELGRTLDSMMIAWNRFIGYKPFKLAVNGWFRSLEVVHDVNELITPAMWYGDRANHVKGRAKYYKSQGLKIGDPNPNFDLMHPHFHVLLAVNKSYFKDSRIYLNQEKWVQLWNKALRADYVPVVDVRRIKGDVIESVSEACKYTVKDADYIVPADWDLTTRTVAVLDKALDKRRFLAFGGALKEAHKLLHLDDAEDGDLVHTDVEQEQSAGDRTITYAWSSGYRQYIFDQRG